MAIFTWLAKLFAQFSKKRQDACSANPGINALLDVIRLVAEASKGTAVILGTGANPLAALVTVGTLFPDILKVLAEYGEIPCEIEAMKPENFETLLTAVMADFGLGS